MTDCTSSDGLLSDSGGPSSSPGFWLTASKVLTALETRGLVVRTRDPSDARSLRLTQTNFGRPKVASAVGLVRALDASFFANTELASLARVLRSLASDATDPSSAPGVAGGVPEVHQVVAALVAREGRVLLCHRSAGRKWYPDVWDLPGGHIEAGETPTSALVRELAEELNICIAEPSAPELARISTPGLDMRIWLVEEWSGSLLNASPHEHDQMAWFGSAECSGLHPAHESYCSLIRDALAGAAG